MFCYMNFITTIVLFLRGIGFLVRQITISVYDWSIKVVIRQYLIPLTTLSFQYPSVLSQCRPPDYTRVLSSTPEVPSLKPNVRLPTYSQYMCSLPPPPSYHSSTGSSSSSYTFLGVHSLPCHVDSWTFFWSHRLSSLVCPLPELYSTLFHIHS